MYCLQLGNQGFGARIGYFARLTTLTDQRSFKLRSERQGFKFGKKSDNAEIDLLDYMLNKNEYRARAKKRLESIAKKIGQESTWVDE